MNTPKLHTALSALRQSGEKAMGVFVTNGFPHPSATPVILRTIDESGADFIELGMPFSDPLAEGLPIQRSSARALAHGVKMADAFRAAEEFRTSSDTPLLLMGYINPVFRYGVEAFCRDAAAAGVDGLILPDLPPEEAHLIQNAAAHSGLSLVFLVAPNTSDERIRLIDDKATAFVYAVTITGLTGSDIGSSERVDEYLRRLRGLIRKNPLMAGFGIKTHGDAERYSRHTDGFIVGSAVIETIERLWDDNRLNDPARLAALGRFIRELKWGEGIEA